VSAGLAKIKAQSDEILQLALEIMRADDGKVYLMDMLATGAVKRHVSTAAGLTQLIRSRNMLAARAVLRLQLDTAIRFSAAWMTDSPNAFAKRVLDGERIDRIKDSNGAPLRDAHLVSAHKAAFPWLPEVYARLSGYVHLSDSHIFAPITSTGNHAYETLIGETNDHYPESSWTELTDCFFDISMLLFLRLMNWKDLKNMRLKTTPPAGS
jgi:hypothetical protein